MNRKTQRELAAQFGLSQQSISYVLRRDGYRSEDRIAARNVSIRAERADGLSAPALAVRYGLSERHVRRILAG